MVIDQERTEFEAAMWTYYLDLKAKGWSAPGEGDPTPEALFWREESGKYGVLSVEAAWNGWQMARKSEVPAPAACAETLIFEDYPEFHAEGMGCGLEDRNITDRYEAMRYGWDEALEAVGLNITGFLSDLPQTAPVAQLSEPPDPFTDDEMVCAAITAPVAGAHLTPASDNHCACIFQGDRCVEQCKLHGSWNAALHGQAEELKHLRAAGVQPSMRDALDAGDGTLHGAIDYWQTKCVELEAKLRQSAQHGECDFPPLGWRCTREAGHGGPCAAIECPGEIELVRQGMERLKPTS